MAKHHHILVANHVPNLKAGTHNDGEGLRLIVQKSGARSWAGRYYREGQTLNRGLGSYPEVGVAAARAAHKAMRDRIKAGEPEPEEPVAEPSKPGGPTFAAVAEKVIPIALTSERRHPDKPTKSEQRWRNAIYKHAANLCERPIRELGTDDILSVLEPIWTEIPSGSRKTREHLHRVFAYAIAKGDHGGPNPARWEGHLDQLLKKDKPPSTPHPALPFRQAPRFLTNLRTHEGVGAAALELVLFTGVRTGELRLATWGEIDWKTGIWMIPREHCKERKTLEKLHRTHKRIPLSAPAKAVLERVRPARPRRDGPIFSVDGEEPISENTMLDVLEAMGLKGQATTHGFRSTYRDWTAEQRVRLPTGRYVPAYSYEAAEIALGHNVGSEVERAYRRTDHLEERIDLARDWADYVLGVQRAVVDPADQLNAFLRDTDLFARFEEWRTRMLTT